MEAKLSQVEARVIAQLDVLEVVPDAFIGIEVRSISWQPLDEDLLSPEPSDEGVHIAVMNRRAIPQHQQRTTQKLQQVLKKQGRIEAGQGAVAGMGVEPALWGDAADDGEMVTREQWMQQGALPARGIGACEAGDQVEPGLVDQHDLTSLLYRVFFSSGQRSRRKRSMAASSRWSARWMGSCGDHCSCLSSRVTCAL